MAISNKDLMVELLGIEEKNDVSSWKFREIHIWPLIKNIAFFHNRSSLNLVSVSPFKKTINYLNRLKKKINKFYNLKIRTKIDVNALKSADILFTGANPYCNHWNGKIINRYFYPIMRELKSSTIYFNYSFQDLPNFNSGTKYCNIHRITGDQKRQIKNLKNEFDILLQENNELKNVLYSLSSVLNIQQELFIKLVLTKVEIILKWQNTWLNVLEIVQPKLAIALCYYDDSMFGLILALRKKNIPSVDMQHGGQGLWHPAYSFSKSVSKKMNLLPDYFWVWEESSGKNITNWSESNGYKIIIGGNPWINFVVKNTTHDFEIGNNKKYILYSLTTETYPYIIPIQVLDSIARSSSKYVFGLRFHPRTKKEEKATLLTLLKEKGIFEKVDLHFANTLSLPFLLSKSWAHIAESSGSIVEASMIGVERNIIINEVGAKYFEDLLKNKKAYYFDIENEKNDLLYFIESIEENFFENMNFKKKPDYNELLLNIIK